MTIEFYHLLFPAVIEMITFFSFNHTTCCITLIDFLLKCLCIPGTTNCNYFLFWVPFLAPCLRSCFGGSMSFPVLGTHQKLQFFSWNVLLEGSGSLVLLISDVVGGGPRGSRAEPSALGCVFATEEPDESQGRSKKQPSKVTYFGL